MYWVTFVCVGGYVVTMAFCRLCSPSVSVCSPHIHCSSMRFVMRAPLSFTSPQFSGSVVTIWFIEAWPISRASIIRGISSVLGGFCAGGCVGAGCWVSLEARGIVTCATPEVVLVSSLLAIFRVLVSRAVDIVGALSSGAGCLVVSLV